MKRYASRVQSLLTAFLSAVGTLLVLAVVGCAELRPYVKSILDTFDNASVSSNTNLVVAPASKQGHRIP